MAQFKVGDQVRLKGGLSFDKAGRPIEEHTVGQVIDVTSDGYVVQFADNKTAIEGILDDEIELDQ